MTPCSVDPTLADMAISHRSKEDCTLGPYTTLVFWHLHLKLVSGYRQEEVKDVFFWPVVSGSVAQCKLGLSRGQDAHLAYHDSIRLFGSECVVLMHVNK